MQRLLVACPVWPDSSCRLSSRQNRSRSALLGQYPLSFARPCSATPSRNRPSAPKVTGEAVPPETVAPRAGQTQPDAADAASQLLPSRQYPEACPPVPSERLRLSRISWAPSSGYFLKKCSQLLTISEMFPRLCNFASANDPSP